MLAAEHQRGHSHPSSGRGMKLMGRSLQVPRLLPTSMRMGSMGVRLIGFVVLARFVDPTDYAEFAFAAVTSAFAAFILGAELYTHTIFKLSKTEIPLWEPFVSRQYSAIGFILAGFWVGAAILYLASGQELVLWVSVLATSEVLNQENNRLLVIAKIHVFSAAMLFLRQVLWLVSSFVLLDSTIFVDPTNAVLCAWLGASVLTAASSSLRLYTIGVRIRFVWLKFRLFRRFVQASALMFLSGLALRGLISLDKIVLGLSDMHHILAAYAFFSSMAFAVVPILDNAVFIYLMPSLVESVVHDRHDEFKRQIIQSAKLVGGLIAVYLVASMLFVHQVIGWIDRPYYAQHLKIFVILLFACALYAFAMLSYYGLYALKQKHLIFRMNVAAVIVCQALYAALYLASLPMAMPIAMLGAMSFLALGHAATLFWCYRRERS